MNRKSNGTAQWIRRFRAPTGAVAALAVFLAAVPLTLDESGLLAALALAGNGNGKDNGNGRDNGNGGDRGRGGANANAQRAPGHGVQSHGGGTKVKLPGSLNATNASSTAFEHANRRSRVGALAAYMDAMQDYAAAVDSGDVAAQEAALDAAAAALADAANKNIAIDAGVVDAVNEALDGKQAGFEHSGEPGDPIHDAEQAIAERINLHPM